MSQCNAHYIFQQLYLKCNIYLYSCNDEIYIYAYKQFYEVINIVMLEIYINAQDRLQLSDKIKVIATLLDVIIKEL